MIVVVPVRSDREEVDEACEAQKADHEQLRSDRPVRIVDAAQPQAIIITKRVSFQSECMVRTNESEHHWHRAGVPLELDLVLGVQRCCLTHENSDQSE